jgi:hypothetical protein
MKLMIASTIGFSLLAAACAGAPDGSTSHAEGIGITCDAASGAATFSEPEADPTLYALVYAGGAQDGVPAEIRWDGASGSVTCAAPGWVELVRR